MKCELCGKKTVFGNRVAHDRMYVNGRSPRKVKPNLHRTTVMEHGKNRQVTACARCIRTLRKSQNLPRQ